MSATLMEGDVSLDSAVLKQLSTAEAKSLLDTIDDLRELQVSSIVNLPQIIVVGAQSSGKSSVLEAISRVRFPTDGRVCTRFATELILRQAPTTTVDVSIQFSKKNDQSDARPFQLSGFSKDNLPELVNQAKERMGIRDGIKEFSDDILRVKISGPEVEQLTLVDLPGLYQGSTAEQSKEGVNFVTHLIDHYMRQENSIILAVVSANYNLANQKILDETKKHDPKRERTLGVITKPDLAGVADQRHFLQLAKNQEAAHKLTLGWHVLRNRAEKEEEQGLGDKERDAQEARFFQTGPWSSVPAVSRGVEGLRKKLSKVLLQHIQKTLPSLVGEIETKLNLRTGELQRLGMSRSTPEEWRSYLLGVARDFERLAHEAIDGRYRDPFFGDLHDGTRKLRALLRNLNRAFDVTLCTKGTTYEFEWYAVEGRAAESDGDPDGISEGDADRDQPAYLRPFIAEYKFPTPKPRSEAQVNEELENWASANQGREFPGSPNNSLAIELFKVQARPWKAIAEFHVTKVLDISKAVIEQLLGHIVGVDKTTLQALLRDCVDPFFDRKRDILIAKLEELLRPYVSGNGLPLEREFHRRVSKRTLGRLAEHLADTLDGLRGTHSEYPTRALTQNTIEHIFSNAGGLRNSKFGTESVIDMTVAYYEMSLGIFTDNVINLAIENCLVCDIPNILTTTEVGGMSEDRLKALASESEEVQAQRNMLQGQVDILRRGLQKCKQHKPRESASLPLDFLGHPASASDGQSTSSGATPSSPVVTPARPLSNAAPVTTTEPVAQQVPSFSFDSERSTGPPPPSVSATNPPANGAGLFRNPTPSPAANTYGLFGKQASGSGIPAAFNSPRPSTIFGTASTPKTAETSAPTMSGSSGFQGSNFLTDGGSIRADTGGFSFSQSTASGSANPSNFRFGTSSSARTRGSGN